ncbi:MAG TPA: type II toxin-antitoxin system RelE/ParE family toxin [Hyphomicrobiales bacterium]|nr:type II toxin-antitoxin system RelE/ParE family toxin [Hyphomicrobiales bacterium]
MRIVRTTSYLRAMRKLGASDADIGDLERIIQSDPSVGDVVVGLRGVRKIRFGFGGRGKRGGGRAIYYALWTEETVFMLLAYAKARKEELTPADRKALLRIIEELES